MAARCDETERLSQLIGDIYDASLDPALWRPVLEKTCHFIKTAAAAMVVVHTYPPEATELSIWWGAEERYANSFCTFNAINPLNVPTLLHARPGSVVAAADILPYEEFAASRCYTEWYAPQRFIDAVIILLEKSATNYVGIGLPRHERQGRADEPMRRRAELLTPHFRRAVAIGKIVETKKVEAAALADTLDGLTSAMFLVGSDGRIMHANANGEAMLRAGTLLHDSRATLAVRNIQGDRALKEVIAGAALGDTRATGTGANVPLAGRDGDNYVAHVLPLGAGARRQAGANYSAVAAVFVRKAELELPHPVEALAKHYKLTAAEMRVLLAIVEGGGVAEVSRTLEVSEATVKTHLQRIFDKTGSARQAQLVKLVAAFASPLGGPNGGKS
jgi:DNA-binding CsgD family transcriptional regulator